MGSFSCLTKQTLFSTRLDEAACGMLSQKISSVDLQNEFEMFRTEIRGQIYFNLAALILKKSQEVVIVHFME